MLIGLLCLSFFASAVSHGNDSTHVNGVRLWRAPDHTRVVFDLSNAVEHKLFQLENPSRLVIDIDNTKNTSSVAGVDVSKTPIKRIRTAVHNNKHLRVVFDLSTAVKPRSFVLKRHEGKPDRLVVDLYDKNSVTKKTVKQTTEPQTATRRRDIVIVVDAGHGGEDPGAIGPRRIKEKTVVLDIAKQLAKKINSVRGYRAVMTRTSDYYVPLVKRRDIARKERADLFVSIHADAFTNPKAKGASVFALSRRGATSETARFLAKRENAADLIGGVGDLSLADVDKTLAGVLVDLSMTATVGASLDVGKHVLKNMGSIAALHKNHVEQAGFAVLKSPDVPSILVETGFISNPKEAKRLGTSRYRKKMANTIFKGIQSYFERTPPAGTYLAWQKNGGGTIIHKVVSGDNLSTIAQRYGVTTKAIKKMNKLSSSSIRIGQRLTIVADEAKTNNTPVKTTNVTPAKNTTASIENKTTPAQHTVASGETLSAIALRYDVTVTELKEINRLQALTIRVGQQLKLRLPPAANNVTPPKSVTNQPKTHIVVNGDTLSAIALRYNISVAELKKINQLNNTAIRVGQTLSLLAAPASSPLPQVAVDVPAAKAPISHRVSSGETLSGIALRYNTTIGAIRKLNKLSDSAIRIGQTLKIPVMDG